MSARPVRLIASFLVVLFIATTGAARADDFQSDAPAEVTPATTTVDVWVVAVGSEGPWDGNAGGCNVHLSNDSHTVTAAIASTGAAVAGVSPSSLTFGSCGEAGKQAFTITFAGPDPCVDLTSTITISKQSVAPSEGAVKGVFNTETINVRVPTDGSGTTCGGNDCQTTNTCPQPVVCSEPAAPAWAAQILKLNGVKPKQGDNLISLVAKAMTSGAVFDGIAKSNHPGYENAVYTFLQSKQSLGKGPGDVKLAKPAWDCTTVSV